jgi:LPXTG-motif cell wall-anchored protein
MKTLIAILLIVAGVWLFNDGWQRRASLKGKTQSALADLARRVDGDTRVPEHNWYMIAGGVCVLAGAGVLFAGKKK